MPELHILRITLELLSPMSIGTGRSIDGAKRERQNVDTGKTEEAAIQASAIIRAANGLPGIPGSSWQGRVRSLAGADWARTILGHEGSGPDGQAGRVICGWGAVHNSDDEAIPETADVSGTDDKITKTLLADAPVWRDHVALTHKHGPDGAKKFARSAVPAGTRFSIEASIWGDDAARHDLTKLLALFRHPEFRLGSARNRGYGRVRVVRASRQSFGLGDTSALREARRQAASTPLATVLLDEAQCDAAFAAPGNAGTVFRVALTARDFLRVGAATEAAVSYTGNTKGARNRRHKAAWAPGTPAWDADVRVVGDKDNVLKLLTEPRIIWDPPENGGKGNLVNPLDVLEGQGPLALPLPGSALGGQLSHRTIYWWNKAAGKVITAEDADNFAALSKEDQKAFLAGVEAMGQRPSALVAVFGTAKSERDAGTGQSPGQAGALRVEDGFIASDWVLRVDHASIDRFTGGVRDRTGALFSEEVLVRPTITAELFLRKGPETGEGNIGGFGAAEAKAFVHALKDLCTGHLPVGARSLGTCTGSVEIDGTERKGWLEVARAVGLPLPSPGGAA